MAVERFIVSIWLGLVLVSGCQKPAGNPGGASSNSIAITEAQPKLPTMKLWLGKQELITEIARTPPQWAAGMMFRKEMAENEAMLFVFPQPHRASFYMRNTLIPLSCAYIDSDGVILEIRDMKPLDESAIVAASDKVRFVLETRQGWFPRNQVPVGTVVTTDHGPLLQAFFGKR